MSLSRPSAVLTLGGRSLNPAEASLSRLRLRLSLGSAHDAAELILAPGSKLAPAAGATLEVALGEVGSEVAVWTGEVTAVSTSAGGTMLEGLDATVALSRTRRSQTYLRQSVAEIVRDLGSDVDVEEVEAPMRLEAYSVDDRRSAWSHLLGLARLAGCDIGASPAGGLRFVPPKTVPGGLASLPLSGVESPLRYGANVLAWSLAAATAAQPARTAALGAASEQGAERWHWLRRDPVPSPDSTPTWIHAALRTRDAADAASKALAGRAQRAALRGEMAVAGRPAVRPGDVIEAKDLPPPSPGPLRVLAVEHLLDGRKGFVTLLTVEGSPGGGGALLGRIGL